MAIAVHSDFVDRYDFSGATRVGLKVEGIVCPDHGVFAQYAKFIKSGKMSCPKCGRERLRKSLSLTTEKFIERARELHGTVYDYSGVEYRNMYGKVKIGCPEHGVFEMLPISHLHAKARCPRCAARDRGAARKATKGGSYVGMLQAVHGETYDYGKFIYQGSVKKAEIVCPKHGPFWMAAGNHLAGQGCPECRIDRSKAAQRMSPEVFLARCGEAHKDRYDYSQTKYVNATGKIDIICPDHGVFTQLALNHLYGLQGCPSCGQKSRGEEEVAAFLLGLGLKVERRDKQIIAPLELDIVLPDLKIAVEYCGVYWHSEINGTPPAYHLAKHLLAEKAGYRLVTLFEDEWLEQRSKVEATLRHFAGKSERGISAREATIREITWAEAGPFLDQHHLLSRGTSPALSVGAFDGDRLIGAMVFGAPSDERGATGQIEMKRYVCDSQNHPGLGSRMFKWTITQTGWKTVTAFVDRRWFGGSFKLHSGFKMIGESRPSMFWTKGQKRYHRRFISKDQLALKHGPGLTKPAMMQLDGYSRIWDCGKLKFEWTSSP